jgi:hypothetical protein
VVGPLAGLLVPASLAAETAPLGTFESADRYLMPDAHVRGGPGGEPAGPPDASQPPTGAGGPP